MSIQSECNKNAGVCFETITKYVMSRIKMSKIEVENCIINVLNAGLAMRTIIQDPSTGKFRLTNCKPPGLACKIKEPCSEDDSSLSDCD